MILPLWWDVGLASCTSLVRNTSLIRHTIRNIPLMKISNLIAMLHMCTIVYNFYVIGEACCYFIFITILC